MVDVNTALMSSAGFAGVGTTTQLVSARGGGAAGRDPPHAIVAQSTIAQVKREVVNKRGSARLAGTTS
jgi:hypothetical protein